MLIPLYDLDSLVIDVATLNEPRSVDNVQSEPCRCAAAHRGPQTLRLHRATSNKIIIYRLLQQVPPIENVIGRRGNLESADVGHPLTDDGVDSGGLANPALPHYQNSQCAHVLNITNIKVKTIKKKQEGQTINRQEHKSMGGILM
jgi:hypothetical protein